MVVRRVSELGELSDAEKRVLAELDTGEVIVIGDGKVPEAGDDSRRVRAALIRLLLLGDDPEPKYRLHEKGLRIGGGRGSRTDSTWKAAPVCGTLECSLAVSRRPRSCVPPRCATSFSIAATFPA